MGCILTLPPLERRPAGRGGVPLLHLAQRVTRIRLAVRRGVAQLLALDIMRPVTDIIRWDVPIRELERVTSAFPIRAA